MNALEGLQVVCNSWLAGSKFAVESGPYLMVSPAMWDLMKHANERELEQLLQAIEVRKVPDMRMRFA